MKKIITVLAALGLLLASCGAEEHGDSTDA